MDHGWLYPTVAAVVTAILAEIARRNQQALIKGQEVIHDLVNSNLTAAKAARDVAEKLADQLSLQLAQKDAVIEELRHQLARLSKP